MVRCGAQQAIHSAALFCEAQSSVSSEPQPDVSNQ